MPAPASSRQIAFLDTLHAERVPFGYDPDGTYDVKQASALISLGKQASRKVVQTVAIEPGYYVMPDSVVYVVVRSKQNAERTYAKVLVLTTHYPLCDGHESTSGDVMGEAIYCDGSCQKGTTTGKWVYTPGAVRDLVGLAPLTVEEAAKLGRKHGVCMVCAKTLMDDVRKGPDGLTSIQRGIGPTCSKRLRDQAATAAVEPAPVSPGMVLATRPVDDDDIFGRMNPSNGVNCTCEDYDGERRCPSCIAAIRELVKAI